jgi:uncharacterized membrane protein YccC
MPLNEVADIERLRRINEALIGRVERSMDQQANAFSLFQTAINLENRIRARTDELRTTLRRLNSPTTNWNWPRKPPNRPICRRRASLPPPAMTCCSH